MDVNLNLDTLRLRKAKTALRASAAHLSRLTGHSEAKIGRMLKGAKALGPRDKLMVFALDVIAAATSLFETTKKPTKKEKKHV